MSSEIQKMLQQFEEWIVFCESLVSVDEETWNSSLAPGKWSIKSIVSHMMLWDRYFYEEAIHKIALGEPLTLVNKAFEPFNRAAAEYAKTVAADELLQYAISYRKKIIQDLRTLSEERANQTYIDGDGNPFEITEYLKDFIGHDQHHMNQMKQFFQERAAGN